MYRFGKYAAGIAVSVSIIAVLGLPVRADVPPVPTGTWTAGGAFGEIPSDAASAVLADGRLVVTGGSAADGQPVTQIALYDPAAGTWVTAGEMNEARAGHTATVLADGRVLITGGRTSAGVTSSIELYDPVSGVSAAAGALSLPRVHHAATRLIDKRVLIVGGSDGNAALAIAEMFDPETGSIAPLPASLSTPRMSLSATTLLDGHVLVAGGNDGTQDLASAELFDAHHGIFWLTSSLNTARSGHLAMLLPHNNAVLIVGGGSNGTPLASVERFAHWSETFYADANSMAGARTGAVGVPVQRDGVVLVGGGGPAEAELYGFATLRTDKDDYAPGEIVTMTGSGWQPGETVHLTISEYADNHHDFEYTAVADEFGQIVNQEFYPREDETFHHMGMRFYAMARGIASEAQTTFTDAGTLTITFAGDGSGSVSGTGAGHQPADFAACISAIGSCALVYTSNGTVTLTPAADQGSTFDGWSGACSGSGPCLVQMRENRSVTATFKKTAATPIITVTGGSFTYDATPHPASATATVNGVIVPGTFSFTYNGFAAPPVNAGNYEVVSSFTPVDTANYNNATGSGTITIEQATPVVTVNGGTFTYDGNPHAATAEAQVNGVSVAGTFSFEYNGGAAEPVNAGTYDVIASFTSSDTINYKSASGDGTITITKADAAVTVHGATVTYDGTEHGATGSATGAAGEDLSSLLNFGATFVDVPGGTADWTFAGDQNHNEASGSVSIVIEKADAAINVEGGTYTYDGQAWGAYGTATSVTGQDLTSLLNFGATFVNVPGGTADWTFAGDQNHNEASGSVSIVIEKADAIISVTGGTYTYDGQEHGATGTATGAANEELTSLLTFGEKFVNVPGGTAHWSFAGDQNHNADTGSVDIVINKAPQTIVVTMPAPDSALYNTSFTVAALGGGSGNLVTFNADGSCTNIGATFTMTSGYGACTVKFNQAGNSNYEAAAQVEQSVNAIAWQVTGFYQPVTSSGPADPIWNVVKGGSTVPLKFEIFAGVNGTEQTSLSAVKSMSAQPWNCTAGVALELPAEQLADTGGSSLRHDGSQFIQNWKTPKTPGACFMVTMTAADSSKISAFFQVK